MANAPAPVLTEEALKAIPDSLLNNWGWLVALGVLMIVLGVIGLGMSFALTLASVLFFGVLLLIGGGAALIDAFRHPGWKSTLWHVLLAILYVAAGIAVITDPLVASVFITLLIAITLIASGVLRLIIAFQHKGVEGWWLYVIGAALSIVLGLMIMAKWPVSGLWIIGLFVAIEIIATGGTYLGIGLAARRARQAREAQGGAAAAATGA